MFWSRWDRVLAVQSTVSSCHTAQRSSMASSSRTPVANHFNSNTVHGGIDSISTALKVDWTSVKATQAFTIALNQCRRWVTITLWSHALLLTIGRQLWQYVEAFTHGVNGTDMRKVGLLNIATVSAWDIWTSKEVVSLVCRWPGRNWYTGTKTLLRPDCLHSNYKLSYRNILQVLNAVELVPGIMIMTDKQQVKFFIFKMGTRHVGFLEKWKEYNR